MQSCFRVFKEFVFFNFWILDSGFWFPVPVSVSGSGFQFPCFRVALFPYKCSKTLQATVLTDIFVKGYI